MRQRKENMNVMQWEFMLAGSCAWLIATSMKCLTFAVLNDVCAVWNCSHLLKEKSFSVLGQSRSNMQLGNTRVMGKLEADAHTLRMDSKLRNNWFLGHLGGSRNNLWPEEKLERTPQTCSSSVSTSPWCRMYSVACRSRCADLSQKMDIKNWRYAYDHTAKPSGLSHTPKGRTSPLKRSRLALNQF